MKSKEELAYSTLSSKLNGFLRPVAQSTLSKKSENLDFLKDLEGFPKKKTEAKPKIEKKELPKYILAHNTPVFESAEQIAAKLNSMPGILASHVLDSLITVEDVIEAIRNLKGNDRLDVSNLRNGEQLSRISQRIDMNDMRWHGGGSTSSSSIAAFVTTDVTTSTNGQTVITSTKNVVATLYLSIGGTVLTPTTDYTTTTTQATLTAASYPNGIPAGLPIIWQYLS